MEAPLTVTVNLLVLVDEQDGVVYADCPLLNVLSHGASEAKALEHFKEEVEFLLEVAYEDGIVEGLLKYRTSLRLEDWRAGALADGAEGRKTCRVPVEIPAEHLWHFAEAAAAFH